MLDEEEAMSSEEIKTVTCQLCNKDFLVSSDRRICLKCQREIKEREMTVKDKPTVDDKPNNSSLIYERALNDIKELCKHRDLGALAPMVTLLRISQIIKTIDTNIVERRKTIPIPGTWYYPDNKEAYKYFKLTSKGREFPDRRKT